MFKAHELVGAGATTVPRFAADVFQAVGVELDWLAEIGATNLTDGTIKLLRRVQNIVKLLIAEIQNCHVS